MLLEICAGSLQSALNAQSGCAQRIELCDNLEEGGTTPSPGNIRQAIQLLNIPVFILIRPRPGDFIYTDDEMEVMRTDIQYCKAQGAGGVVLGILKSDGAVDKEKMAELILLARPMQVTFHRAFDMARDPFEALEDIISLGCNRLLTSGQAMSAPEGAMLLADLVRKAGDRIMIMPGGGINEQNVTGLIQKTGVKEIHASLRSQMASRMKYRNRQVSMGRPGSDDYSRMVTDSDRVREMISRISSGSPI